ncbi:dolichyl-phosphate beta-glucosyltransferase [Selaginella moellendorffii]|uniref:dolichyl-phosphate beta-glucosyltransferase n=1 Tax=Selaginella moellendorffii TaxID=88036 RepID=UPI000D1C37B0|nr:dolichyl-phosphate beta-glucosyltransferase [Selaginella moellendorffii]|eukprot:XP_024526403.1 dolichyl-phosphate beta-glucosyltransferase [Selaginella moellendorffii]
MTIQMPSVRIKIKAIGGEWTSKGNSSRIKSRALFPGVKGRDQILGFRVLRPAPARREEMGLLVPLSQISPVLVGIIVVVFSSALWLLSYIVEWTQKLDQGSGTTTPSFLENPSSLEKVRCPSVFGPPEKYLSLVIPAFDEEARLPLTLDETLRYLEGRAAVNKSFTYEIIIVDDGSRDNTVKVAFDYIKKYKMDNVRLIKQGVNCGKGAAVTKGALCSRGELILMLDADGATKITNLEKLENAILTYGEKIQKLRDPSVENIFDVPLVACGSRAHLEQQALATRKWYRNFLMKGFHLCVLLAAGSGIRDTQCGFKMFTRSAAQQLFINLRLTRWCFDVELLYLCKRLGIPALEIAVNWTEIPGSKLRMTSILHMLFELLLIRIGYGFNVWKIHQNLVQTS